MAWNRPLGANSIASSPVPLYDVAWICTACGHIMLGPASVPDGPDFPHVPDRRCPTCRTRAWRESVLPARRFDGPFVDCLITGERSDRRRRTPFPLPVPRSHS